MSDAVLIVSTEGRIVRVNGEAQSMFGYPRQELLGQSLEILLSKYASSPSTHPKSAVTDALARRRDGSEFLVDLTLSPAAGGGVIAVARDVSDRQRMNQELHRLTSVLKRRVVELARQANILESILNSMGEGVIVCDQTGKLLLVNPAAVRLNAVLGPALRGGETRPEWGSISEKFGLFQPDTVTLIPTDELPLSRVLRGEVVESLDMFIRTPEAPEGICATATGRRLLDGGGNPAGGVVVVRDTTAQKFAQGALLAGQEAEGKRIARELHDSVSQDLCGLILDMALIQRDLPGSFAEIGNRLNSHNVKLMELADEVDSVCRQLHPSVLERIGLNQAMEELCDEFTRRKGLATRFYGGDIPASLPAASALCLYRVAQESLRNIVRHARAAHATVLLSSTHGRLQLSIEDDGVGFDRKTVDAKGRLGLVSMRERVRLVGGSLTICSEPGHGTRIELDVPLLDESQRPDLCHTMPAILAVA